MPYGLGAALPQLRSFRNLTPHTLNFSASGRAYSILPFSILSLDEPTIEAATQLQVFITQGLVEELTVFGAPKVSISVPVSPPPPASGSIDNAGSFDGVSVDTATGLWILSNPNRLIYPNSVVRHLPPPGLNSQVTLGASMRRTGTSGSLGFALFTNAGEHDTTFTEGYLVLFEQDGIARIYMVNNNLWKNVGILARQIRYPVDLLEHTYAVALTQYTSGSLQIIAYLDGIEYAQATINNNLFRSGRFGFSTPHGSSKTLVQPSAQYTLGAGLHETLSVAVQQVISNISGSGQLNVNPTGGVVSHLPIANLDPSVTVGSVYGTSLNLVGDSDFKFGNKLWNNALAGSLSVVNSIGMRGAKGIAFINTGASQRTESWYYRSAPITLSAGATATVSGNIRGTDCTIGGSDLPAWEVWNSSFTTKITSAKQQLGIPLNSLDITQTNRRVSSSFVVASAGDVIVVAATNGVNVAASGTLVFSEPQLELGPYATSYKSSLMDDHLTSLPLATHAPEVTTTIVSNGSGGGALLLGTAATGSIVPYPNNSNQVTSVVKQQLNPLSTFVLEQVVGTTSILPTSIFTPQGGATIYDNSIANIYGGVTDYSWYLVGTGPVSGASVIPNGSIIAYTVGVSDPAATPAPVLDSLTIDKNSTITVLWNHPPYLSTSAGANIVAFTGSSAASAAAASASSTIAGNSNPSITVTGTVLPGGLTQTFGLSDVGDPFITSGFENVTHNIFQSSPATASLVCGVTATQNIFTQNVATTGTLSGHSHPRITENLPGHFANVDGSPIIFFTDSNTVAPATSATQFTFTINSITTPSDANGSTSFTVQLYNNNGILLQGWTGITSPQTLTYIANTVSNLPFKWQVWGVCTNNAVTTEIYDCVINATVGWYDSVTVNQTNYFPYASNSLTFVTPSNTEAPVAAGVEVSLNITAISCPNNAAATSFFNVTLTDPNSTVVQTWPTVTTTTDLTYFNSSAVSGSYTYTVYSNCSLGSAPATGSYTDTMTATLGSYYQFTDSELVYTNNPSGSAASFTTPANTTQPTSVGSQLTLSINTISCPSNSEGFTYYSISLFNPNGTTASTWSVTGAQTLTYHNVVAAPGSYTWQALAQVSNASAGNFSYSTSLSSTGSYLINSGIQPAQFVDHAGVSSYYRTPANTSAPTSSAKEIILNLSSVTTPSDANGQSFLDIFLYSPTNTLLASAVGVTSPTTITYFSGAAASGTYTWQIYGACTDNQVAAGSYLDLWNGSYSWYAPLFTSGSVFIVSSDRGTQINSSSDGNIQFTKQDLYGCSFKISNNASVALPFTLGMLSQGF